MENEIRDKVERLRIKAELFLNSNIKAFIKDTNNTYYFCDILTIGEAFVYVQNFKGQRQGVKERIFWSDIIIFEEYKEMEK